MFDSHYRGYNVRQDKEVILMGWNRSRNSNVTTLHPLVGRTGTMLLREECTVAVMVVDVKIAYGQVRYLIEPVAGSGSAWVLEATVQLDEVS